jgi:hypothetical protein
LRVGRQHCPFRIYHLARLRAVGCTVRLYLLVAGKAKLISPEIESHGVCVYVRTIEVTRAIGRREGMGMLETLSLCRKVEACGSSDDRSSGAQSTSLKVLEGRREYNFVATNGGDECCKNRKGAWHGASCPD